MLAFRFTEMKIYKYNAGLMTKMAAILVYGKIPLKVLFPRTRGMITRKLGMQHRAPSHHILFKSWPLVDLDLFFGKVNFWNLRFYIEKCDSDGFFGN